MAKALTENQCNWLHQQFPPPNCCICNHKVEVFRLQVKNEQLENLLVDRESLIAEYIMTEKQVQVENERLKALLHRIVPFVRVAVINDELPQERALLQEVETALVEGDTDAPY